MDRYRGGCERLAKVSAIGLVALITSRKKEDWPDYFWSSHKHRPLVIPVAVLNWDGLQDALDNVVSEVLTYFPGCYDRDRVITTVSPGDYVPPHVDMHPPEWRTRIHVPIISNSQSEFIVDGVAQHLEPGMAYKVNTETMHSIRNSGTTNRIHLMFDVCE